MADAKHAAADASFRVSVLRNLGGAALLVVLVAGMFWAIGMIGRADDGPLIAVDDTVGSDGADDPDAATDAPSDDDDPPPADTDDGTADEAEPDDADDAEVDDAQDGDAAADEDGGTGEPQDPDEATDEDTDDSDEPQPEPEPEPEPEPDPPAPSIDPAEVSVQVLDGYQSDGGTAAAAVADELAAAGYDIVARNPALRYDVTAVLWTPGNEDAARQVAEAIGAAEVREQPGNLSNAVAVHVVVGADRA